MPDFEILFLIGIGVALALTGIVLWAALAGRQTTAATRAVSEGRFQEAAEAADLSDDADRDDLWAAAVAAKHLGRWDDAEARLRRILADDRDGEAWLELGLVRAYRGDLEEAERCFRQAAGLRADLLESLTLHRSWIALRRGDARAARHLFEEVESSIETKLRTDMGSGEPLFVEWMLQCAELWSAFGDTTRARWALDEARGSAGDSQLPALLAPDVASADSARHLSSTAERGSAPS